MSSLESCEQLLELIFTTGAPVIFIVIHAEYATSPELVIVTDIVSDSVEPDL